MGDKGADAAIEAHVLLKDWHVKPFDRFWTLHEEQQSWPINQRPVMKTTIGTIGHDKSYDKYYPSVMQQGARFKQQAYHIQDMEPIMMAAAPFASGHGKVFADPEVSAFTDKQIAMDVDWLIYT